MDRFTDEKSGIIFHYVADLSNGVEIVVPPGADGDGTAVSIPMGALVRFFFEAVLSREKAILLTSALNVVAGGLETADTRAVGEVELRALVKEWRDKARDLEKGGCVGGEEDQARAYAWRLERVLDGRFPKEQRRAVVSRVLRERLALEGGEEGISELEADDVADHILKAMK